MKHILLLMMAVLASLPSWGDGLSSKTLEVLDSLDREVKLDSVYTARRLNELHTFKLNVSQAWLSTDKYLAYKHLAEAYSHLSSDSALAYYHQCYLLAEATGNKVWKQEIAIRSAFVLADRGDNNLALMRLRALGDIKQIYPDLQFSYAMAMMNVYVRVTSTESQLYNARMAQQAWQLYEPYVSKESGYYYLFVKASMVHGDKRQLQADIRNAIARKKQNDADMPVIQMALGNLCQELGESDEAIYWLALSAIGDIRRANKNSSAITMLLAELCRQPDVNLTRVENYARLNSRNIVMFNDVGRSIHLVEVYSQIMDKSQAEITHWKTRHYLLLGVVAALLLASVLLSRKLWLQNKLITKQSKVMESNLMSLEGDLDSRSKDIDRKNQLIDNLAGEQRKFDIILAQQLAVMSKMMNDTNNYKKEMARLISVGQTAAARKLANVSATKEQTSQEFSRVLDQNFLFVHPDFPSRLNDLLVKDEQLPLPVDGVMRPEQRIFALISMGVTDSKAIAEMLGYSIQTVYNYRMKLRRACASDDVKLDDAVAEMYEKKK
jgi:hypothetical protein